MLFKITFSNSMALLGMAAAVALAVGGSTTTSATVINVQFEGNSSLYTYTGTAAAPDVGTFWNQSGAVIGKSIAGSNLIASDGTTVTGEGFTLTSLSTNPWYENHSNTTNNNLLESFAVTSSTNGWNSSAMSLNITGLTAGGYYNLYVYGAKDTGANSKFTYGSTTVVTDGNLINAATPFDTADQGHEWNVIDTLVADGSGNLAIAVGSGQVSSYSPVNGFQIVSVSVPESGSAGLLAAGLAGIGLLGVARRHSVK